MRAFSISSAYRVHCPLSSPFMQRKVLLANLEEEGRGESKYKDGLIWNSNWVEYLNRNSAVNEAIKSVEVEEPFSRIGVEEQSAPASAPAGAIGAADYDSKIFVLQPALGSVAGGVDPGADQAH
ncbi:hypothetical protein LIER_14084 [Lithospermum erythrorhizon]|uniref:Uncharacterized protein n=1 Tax=Lithospermum erythrorhizon TaxID=34254 RepID=A0AAV3Q1Z1_LITER